MLADWGKKSSQKKSSLCIIRDIDENLLSRLKIIKIMSGIKESESVKFVNIFGYTQSLII